MQQEIKLSNESSNTVFVDDVDVSKGVYYTNEQNSLTLFVINDNGRYELIDSKGFSKNDKGDTFIELLQANYWRSGNFYTIPDNKRIVTERELTIDDLKNTDHVGFVDSEDDKGFIVSLGESTFKAILGESSNGYTCNNVWAIEEPDISKLFNNIICKAIYRFTTRKELYQWLAE